MRLGGGNADERNKNLVLFNISNTIESHLKENLKILENFKKIIAVRFRMNGKKIAIKVRFRMNGKKIYGVNFL